MKNSFGKIAIFALAVGLTSTNSNASQTTDAVVVEYPTHCIEMRMTAPNMPIPYIITNDYPISYLSHQLSGTVSFTNGVQYTYNQQSNIMVAEILLIPQQHGKTNWELRVTTPALQRTFELGNDNQFCLNHLGADLEIMQEVVRAKNLQDARQNRVMANYICMAKDIYAHTLPKIPSHALKAA